MTAAAMTAAPSERLRRPAPSITPAAGPRELGTTIVGELAEDAHASVEAVSHRAALSVVLAQGYGLPKVLGTLWLGDDVDSILDAEYLATTLPAGALVRVQGDTLRMRYHHGALAIMLGTVRSIERAEEATP